jgi:hypothetical protein
MFFMARAAPPIFPGWLVLTRTTRMFCSKGGTLEHVKGEQILQFLLPLSYESAHCPSPVETF